MIRVCGVLALTAVGTAALWTACGPSLRRTHQSDNSFDRCFDMDYDPARSIGEKRDCWFSWLDEHVYNQPDDKLAYARLRLDELISGISIPGPPGPPGAFHERPQWSGFAGHDAGVDDAGGAPSLSLDDGATEDAGASKILPAATP